MIPYLLVVKYGVAIKKEPSENAIQLQEEESIMNGRPRYLSQSIAIAIAIPIPIPIPI
jgi:hypothetical protein